MKNILRAIIIIFAVSCVALCGCSKKVAVDYGDAKAFEDALNSGENLVGKVVQFEASELHPESVLGYAIWSGEHLNFISKENPEVKVGDIVTARAKNIENLLGSWIIVYEKVEKSKVTDDTVFSTDSKEGEGISEKEVRDLVSPSDDESGDNSVDLEYVDAKIELFYDYAGSPTASAYVAFKNNNDYPIKLTDARIDYENPDGRLLSSDTMITCIPQAIGPGQTGYMYSYYHDLSQVDCSAGVKFVPDANVMKASNYYEIEVTDVSATAGKGFDVRVVGRGTNNSGKDQSLAQPGAVFFDKDNNVIGFCYGIESFNKGQTKSFELSGELMSEEYDKSMLDHVEVFIQGAGWY